MRLTRRSFLLLGAFALLALTTLPGCENPFDPLDKSPKIQGLTFIDFSLTWDRWDSDPQFDGVVPACAAGRKVAKPTVGKSNNCKLLWQAPERALRLALRCTIRQRRCALRTGAERAKLAAFPPDVRRRTGEPKR